VSDSKSEADSGWGGPYSERYTRYVLFIVLLVMIFNNADRTVLSILISPIKQEFGLSDTQMGLLMGPAFTLVYTVLALPVARWADFGVRRSIVAGGLFLWSCFTVATYFVTSFFQLFAMRMGVGVGEAAGTAPSLSMLSDYVPRERRASSLSVISIGAVTGLGFGMILGGHLNELYGWRMAFLVAGLPGVLLALILRFTVAEPPRGASEKGKVDTAGVSVTESVAYLFSLRTFWFILVANAFSLFAAMGRNLWEPEFLVRTYELGTGSAGTWYFLTSPLPSMLGIFLGGYFADRLGSRNAGWYLVVPAVGQLVSVPILLAFLLWPEGDRIALPGFVAALGVESIPVAFVLSFVGSIFGSFFTAPFLATLQSISKIRMRALVAALSTTASSFVGHTAGPLVVGAVSDSFEAAYGTDALRYSLLVPTSAPVLSALVCLVGARFVRGDLARVREG
jgi:MFS family permease